jgi:hypothetical protein
MGRKMRGSGRPSLDSPTFAQWLADGDFANEPMRLLVDLAHRRGMVLAQTCRLADQDAGSFRKTALVTKVPQFPVIEAIVTRALGLPPIVARALCGQLTSRDIDDNIFLINGEVGIRSATLFGDPDQAAMDMQSFWREHPAARERAVTAFVLARNDMTQPFDDALGYVLGAVEVAVRQDGFSLVPYIALQDRRRSRIGAGISWFHLMRDSLGLSVKDERTIEGILSRYVSSGTRDDDVAARLQAERQAECAYNEHLDQSKARPAASQRTASEYLALVSEAAQTLLAMAEERSANLKARLVDQENVDWDAYIDELSLLKRDYDRMLLLDRNGQKVISYASISAERQKMQT